MYAKLPKSRYQTVGTGACPLVVVVSVVVLSFFSYNKIQQTSCCLKKTKEVGTNRVTRGGDILLPAWLPALPFQCLSDFAALNCEQ